MSDHYEGRRRSTPIEDSFLDDSPSYEDYLSLRDSEIRKRVAAYEAHLRAHYELNPRIAETYEDKSAALQTAADELTAEADAMEEAVRGEHP